MLKKFLFSLCLMAAISAFQFVDIQKVSAQNYWVYTDKSIDTEYYVLSETIKDDSKPGHISFQLLVKSVHFA